MFYIYILLNVVNSINVMVHKISFAILNKEFVCMFTSLAQDCQIRLSNLFYEIAVSFMEVRTVPP